MPIFTNLKPEKPMALKTLFKKPFFARILQISLPALMGFFLLVLINGL